MRTGRESGTSVGALLILVALLASHAASALLPSVFETLRLQATDRLFELRDGLERFRPTYDERIVHVVIDDESLRQRERFYFDRADHAELIAGLGRAKLAAQAHDFVFHLPVDPAVDARMIRAVERAGNAYFGMAAGARATPAEPPRAPTPEGGELVDRLRWHIAEDAAGDGWLRTSTYFLTFPELAAASRGLGWLDITADRDGSVRRVPLLLRDGDGWLAGFPLRVICDYLGVGPAEISLRPGRIVLDGAQAPGDGAPRRIEIPVDERGRMIVNYLGAFPTMRTYPLFQIEEAIGDRFAMMDLADELAGRVAVVSLLTTGGGDIRPVPIDEEYPMQGVHASAMHAILTGQFLREAGRLWVLLLVELPLLLLLWLASLRLGSAGLVTCAALLTAVHLGGASLAFLVRGLIVDVPGPLVSLAASTVLVVAWRFHVTAKSRAVMRGTFAAFFPPDIVDKMVTRPGGLIAAAERKELTILFSDIAGFTKSSSGMDPARLRDLLNEYFERMIDIVFGHGGTLDKFIGDGLMVFFGDPEPQADHAERAVRAAVEMQRAARELDRDWRERGIDMRLAIRVGINTGAVIVGNMGSERRLAYTVLGDQVNLAARLESAAPVGGVLVSARTAALLDGAVPTRAVADVTVKGFDGAIEVYEVPLEAVDLDTASDPRIK